MQCLMENIIVVDLSKQQALDADPKAIQQINFTGNLDWAGNTTMFIIIEEAEETLRMLHKELWENCEFILL